MVRTEERGSRKLWENLEMRVVMLRTILKRYGGQRHPNIEDFDESDLVEWRYVPPNSTMIYVSHEWAGTDRPDPDGTQMYHLTYMLERLQNGEVSRTDMDAFHSLLYKHNVTTTADDWKRILNSEKTYIWYDGFCVPSSRREDGFRSIPSYIRRCDFMIILAPGCTHFDRIDPRTERRMNLCYRTYRLRARCVFEIFCAFLTTRGGEKARPALLVRSGTGTPNWISPLECLKLAVGTSTFECCETNHTILISCRRLWAIKMLKELIRKRAASLFKAKHTAEARITICGESWWMRELEIRKKRRVSVHEFKAEILRWNNHIDGEWFDRDSFSVLVYAVISDRTEVVRDLLVLLEGVKDPHIRARRLCSSVPKAGLPSLGFSGSVTALVLAMGFGSHEVASLLLEHGADPYVMFKDKA